jgi:uncharacterized protein
MMTSVADQILKQFADNFAAQIAALAAQRNAAATSALHARPAGADATPAIAENTSAGLSEPPPVVRELNGLALIWAVFKDWLRGLLGKKAA